MFRRSVANLRERPTTEVAVAVAESLRAVLAVQASAALALTQTAAQVVTAPPTQEAAVVVLAALAVVTVARASS